MKNISTFNIGDNVVVKLGFKDDEDGYDMGGWQGRITDMDKDSKPVMVSIQWDSITLKNIPLKLIEQYEETGMSWDEYNLYAEDIGPATPRDTEDDVEKVIDEIVRQTGWISLGEEGRRIQKVLYGIGPGDHWECYEAWYEYFEETLTFPFKAEVYESEGRGPLRIGDAVRVIGLLDISDPYGVLVDIKKGRRGYDFPLCSLEVTDKKSPLFQIVKDYVVWYANR